MKTLLNLMHECKLLQFWEEHILTKFDPVEAELNFIGY